MFVSQNSGQGLGFVLLGNVIDKKTLTAAAAKLIPVLVAVYGYLLSLEEESGGKDECGLTEAQAASIHAAVAPWRNATCAYNMSLISILD